MSPAGLLPIKRPRLKVIDAGYLENSRVGLLFEWLHRHREWLADNTSGIALIQLQAYSPGLRQEYKHGVLTTAATAQFRTALDQIGRGMGAAVRPDPGIRDGKAGCDAR